MTLSTPALHPPHGSQLVSLHLINDPPCMTAQFIPLALPGDVLAPSIQSVSPTMVDWAWDGSGERLVVLLDQQQGGADDREPSEREVRRAASSPPTDAAAYKALTGGCLAVFSTATDPLVSARLIGYARPPPPMTTGGGAAAAAAGWQRPVARDWRVSTLGAFERGSLFTLSLGSAEHFNLPLIYRGV